MGNRGHNVYDNISYGLFYLDMESAVKKVFHREARWSKVPLGAKKLIMY